jgi:lipid II isoglutaminyl synthase (glutamine-hydrolysing)
MQKFLGTIVGKSVKAGLAYRRGGGQALPGLVVEKLFPNYVSGMLRKLPEGVVIITGTNGKTTTTKMVVHLLKAYGKRVLTNSTGSNLTRGIASSISQHAKVTGRLPYDIAVLEIDEATARRLVAQVKPRWILALNVSRDQLDRYGEVDTIASYIKSAMDASGGVVTNAGDPHLLAISQGLKGKEISYFGFSDNLKEYFPSDYELAAVDTQRSNDKKSVNPDVQLTGFKDPAVTYRISDKNYSARLKLTGQHNFLNAAAALALAKKLLPQTADADLVRQLADVSLAFGRGEKYRLKNGVVVELVLVKNPASFTQALASYGSSKANLMIAINDNIADGRDVSWLWDVNFGPLASSKVAVTSGSRAADMALRLKYDDITVGQIEPNLAKALNQLSTEKGDKVVLATYTAMLSLYSYLTKNAEKIE